MSKQTTRLAGVVLMLALLVSGLTPGTAAFANVISAAPLRVEVAGDRGQPLAGAWVELLAPRLGLAAFTTSSDDGSAIMTPGAGVTGLWLRVWAEGHAVVERPWDPAVVGRSRTVVLPALRGGLSGLVVDPSRLPLAEARVSAWQTGLGLAGETQTGPDGTYLLRNLPAGEYLVQLDSRGFQPQTFTAKITGGRNTHVDTTLDAALGAVAGTVVDARSGRPINGARVELVRQGWGVVAGTTTAGGGGRFQLTASPTAAAEYSLRVLAADYVLVESARFALPPGIMQEFSGDRRLQLAPLYGAIWGFVLRADGQPVAGAAVELQLREAGTVATATADDDGYFSFDRVVPGNYRVRSFPGQFYSASDSDWLTVAAGEQHSVRINPAMFTEQNFGLGTVAGTVSAGGTQPITGATVTLLRGDRVVDTATTDAWGRYRFSAVSGNAGLARSNVPVSTSGYLLRVEAEGYLPTDQPAGGPEGELTVRAGELTAAVFHLRADGLSITGRVLDERSQPLADAAVSLYREGVPDPVQQLTSGPSGHFQFPTQTVAGGSGYFITAEKAGYLPAVPSPLFKAAAAATGQVEMNLSLLPATTRLQGRVADARGDGVPGAKVMVLHAAEGGIRDAETDTGGWFSLEGLSAGAADHYLVRAATVGAPTAASPAVVTPAGQRAVTVQVTVAPPGALAGVITDHRGEPLAGAAVQLRQEGSAAVIAHTAADAQGRYRITDLVPGSRYGLLASAEGYIASSLAPGETGLTPLITVPAGDTARYDVMLLPVR